MDTLGIEPRASRMLSGCDTTTPCALEESSSIGKLFVAVRYVAHRRPAMHGTCPSPGRALTPRPAGCGGGPLAHCGIDIAMPGPQMPRHGAAAAKLDTLGIEPRASRMLSGCDTTTPRALEICPRLLLLVVRDKDSNNDCLA